MQKYTLIRTTVIASLVFYCFFHSAHLFAQASTAPAAGGDEEQQDIDFVDKLLEKNLPQNTPVRMSPPAIGKPKQRANFGSVQSVDSYEDFALIQRNYMPKTERAQISLGLTTVPTDVFFRTLGLNVRLGYHLTENWGAEFFGYGLSSSARSEVNNMENTQLVSVRNLVSIKNYIGLNMYYNFIYGKSAFLNNLILPFEIYQTFGVGKITNQNSEDSTAVQFGVGEMISLSRSSAVRLDLTWAFYRTKNILGQDQDNNSVFLTVGYSFFFPEPAYR